MPSRRATLALLALLLGLWPFLASAQDATPITASGAPLDLAAMALAPDDVPAGYFDDYSELWVPAGPFSELTLGGAAVPPGLVRVYQSFYTEPDGGPRLTTTSMSSPRPRRPRPEPRSSTRRCDRRFQKGPSLARRTRRDRIWAGPPAC
jgi:hypothetical protein